MCWSTWDVHLPYSSGLLGDWSSPGASGTQLQVLLRGVERCGGCGCGCEPRGGFGARGGLGRAAPAGAAASAAAATTTASTVAARRRTDESFIAIAAVYGGLEPLRGRDEALSESCRFFLLGRGQPRLWCLSRRLQKVRHTK